MRRHIGVDGSLPVQQNHHVQFDRSADNAGWPIHFQDVDPGADSGVREVEIGLESVVLRRRIAGITMKLIVRLDAYQGVSVALIEPEGDGEGVRIVLTHADPALSVTLYSAPHADDVVAEWRHWSALLGLPMLMTKADGTLQPAYPMLGRLLVGKSVSRRRRRGALKHRRPSVFLRRAAGRPVVGQSVHRGERELFARD